MSPLDLWRQMAADENARVPRDDDADMDRFHLDIHTRRAEISRLRSTGMKTKDIAAWLGVSHATVRNDLHRERKL